MHRFSSFIFLLYLFIGHVDFLQGQTVDSLIEKSSNPKEVSISFLLLDIMKIDDVNKKMSIDFGLRMTWKDATLKGKKDNYLIDNNPNLWYPQLQFLNSVNLEPRIRKTLDVTDDGTVTFIQRYVGEISLKANFSEFPFDEHDFMVKCVAVNFDSLVFIPNQPNSVAAPQLTLAEWDASDFNLANVPFNTQTRYLPGIEFKMHFKRKRSFIFGKRLSH